MTKTLSPLRPFPANLVGVLKTVSFYWTRVRSLATLVTNWLTRWLRHFCLVNLMPANNANCFKMPQKLLKAVKMFSMLEKTGHLYGLPFWKFKIFVCCFEVAPHDLLSRGKKLLWIKFLSNIWYHWPFMIKRAAKGGGRLLWNTRAARNKTDHILFWLIIEMQPKHYF